MRNVQRYIDTLARAIQFYCKQTTQPSADTQAMLYICNGEIGEVAKLDKADVARVLLSGNISQKIDYILEQTGFPSLFFKWREASSTSIGGLPPEAQGEMAKLRDIVNEKMADLFLLVRRYNTAGAAVNPQPKRKYLLNQPLKDFLPPELQSDDAVNIFKKAIDLGLMDADYKWLKGLQMLACFARDMSKRLNMGKGDRISWKPFEELFGVQPGKLRLNYNDIQKTGQNPTEIGLIDEVFE